MVPPSRYCYGFRPPVDKRFSSPTWAHFAKRFGLALLLPISAVGLVALVHALTADRVLLAQAKIEQLPRSSVKAMMAQEINSGAPMSLDSSTTLLRAEIIEGELFYIYELARDVTDAGEASFSSWVNSNMIPRICQGGTLAKFAGAGIDIALAYLDKSGELFSAVVISGETC